MLSLKMYGITPSTYRSVASHYGDSTLICIKISGYTYVSLIEISGVNGDTTNLIISTVISAFLLAKTGVRCSLFN